MGGGDGGEEEMTPVRRTLLKERGDADPVEGPFFFTVIRCGFRFMTGTFSGDILLKGY